MVQDDSSGLSGLADVELVDRIAGLWPVTALANPERPGMRDIAVDDVSALGGQSELPVPDLSGASWPDVRPLSTLCGLEALLLFDDSSVSYPVPLWRLPETARLDLRGNRVLFGNRRPTG